eukprot:2328081-Rhodomonas_salina.1
MEEQWWSIGCDRRGSGNAEYGRQYGCSIELSIFQHWSDFSLLAATGEVKYCIAKLFSNDVKTTKQFFSALTHALRYSLPVFLRVLSAAFMLTWVSVAGVRSAERGTEHGKQQMSRICRAMIGVCNAEVVSVQSHKIHSSEQRGAGQATPARGERSGIGERQQDVLGGTGKGKGVSCSLVRQGVFGVGDRGCGKGGRGSW